MFWREFADFSVLLEVFELSNPEEMLWNSSIIQFFRRLQRKLWRLWKQKVMFLCYARARYGNLAWFCSRVRSINSAVWGGFFTTLKNGSHGFNILQIGQHVFCWSRCSCCGKEKWRRDRSTLFGTDKSTIFSIFHEGIVESGIIMELLCLYMLLFRMLFFLSFYVWLIFLGAL